MSWSIGFCSMFLPPFPIQSFTYSARVNVQGSADLLCRQVRVGSMHSVDSASLGGSHPVALDRGAVLRTTPTIHRRLIDIGKKVLNVAPLRLRYRGDLLLDGMDFLD